ncbi:MAG: glycerophosphodiester phosphodiesterase family protein [Bacteroidota bacterium]
MLRCSSFFLLILFSCQSPQYTSNPSQVSDDFDIQGHRGCRGLMPENTLPAFQKALELGVNTLEMDLVISQDDKVVVSHEPVFRAGIGLTPDGQPIKKSDQDDHNIYHMPYEHVRKYVLGTIPDSKHPNREDIKTFKPLFVEVVRQAKDYSYTMGEPMPWFNIEIKREKDKDGTYHPPVEKFVDLVLEQVTKQDIEDKTIIQSFDLEALRLTKSKNPRLKTALLIMNRKSPEKNIQELGFKPDVYSCYYKLLSEKSVTYLHEQEIDVIPWTVNSVDDISKMIALGVDGIISDYPDRVIAQVR